MAKEKVVLAYSGGLDTTAIIPWLKETYGYDVVCCCVDVGQESELEGLDERVYPVGRLDRDSEGLILLTNDGDFSNTIAHPRKEINKVYHVTVRPDLTPEQAKKLSQGIVIDGRKTAPCEVRVMNRLEDRTNIEMVLHEGRNREIRKMCEYFDLEVLRLRRISIGSVKMGKLKKGMWRDLTEAEIRKLSSK